MSAKLVQFSDGTFAIRRWGFFGREFLSDVSDHWWPFDYLRNAKFSSQEEALSRWTKHLKDAEKKKISKNDYGTPVKGVVLPKSLKNKGTARPFIGL